MDFSFIDIRTLLISLTIFTLLIGILLINFYYSWKESFQGIKGVGSALILIAVVILFEAVREKLIFSNILSIITSEGILFGYVLIFWGLNKYKKQIVKYFIDYTILIFALIFFVIFALITPISVIKISGLSFFLAIYSFRIFLLFSRKYSIHNRLLNISLAICFFLFGLVNLLRIAFSLKYVSSLDFEYNSQIQAVFLILIIVLECIISLNFIFLLNSEIHFIKDRFLSIFAHDIKSPLNAVIGFSDLLLKNSKTLNEDDKNLVNLINISGKSGYNLITNMLEWSKTQFKKHELKKQKIDINDIVNELIEFFRPSGQMKNIIFEFKQYKEEHFITTDKNLLNIVLRNLISNAVKYTPDKGKVTIIVTEKNNEIEVAVEDTGVGISDEVIEKILNNENVLSNQGTNKEKGTGLGLLLCKQYLTILKGNLKIEVLPEKGSRFSFTLPLEKENQ